MFRLISESHLRSAFRPRDLKAFELADCQAFPIYVRDVFAWVDPSGVRAYLVLMHQGSNLPMGLAFRRDGARPERGAMCDWCHCHGGADQVAMLTCEASSKKRVGVMVCRDLRCAERAEDMADRAGRSVAAARHAVAERMARFAREGLGIERVPVPQPPG